MKRTAFEKSVIYCLMFTIILLLSGCDWSANWDLRRAEKALTRADKLNAEFWAEREYHKAQNAFTEAMDLAREGHVNLARDKALEAKDWADEAILWSEIRAEEMRKEKESLGTYSD